MMVNNRERGEDATTTDGQAKMTHEKKNVLAQHVKHCIGKHLITPRNMTVKYDCMSNMRTNWWCNMSNRRSHRKMSKERDKSAGWQTRERERAMSWNRDRKSGC
jgi:hypothetical protein